METWLWFDAEDRPSPISQGIPRQRRRRLGEDERAKIAGAELAEAEKVADSEVPHVLGPIYARGVRDFLAWRLGGEMAPALERARSTETRVPPQRER